MPELARIHTPLVARALVAIALTCSSMAQAGTTLWMDRPDYTGASTPVQYDDVTAEISQHQPGRFEFKLRGWTGAIVETVTIWFQPRWEPTNEYGTAFREVEWFAPGYYPLSSSRQVRPTVVIATSGSSAESHPRCGARVWIHEIEYDEGGFITKLAADIQRGCFRWDKPEDPEPAFSAYPSRFRVRHGSDWPLEPVGPSAGIEPPQPVIEGGEGLLDGSASRAGASPIVDWYWEQLDGPTVAWLDRSGARARFTAPAVELGGADLRFRVTVTDAAGLTRSAEAVGHVADKSDRFTTIDVAITPSDPNAPWRRQWHARLPARPEVGIYNYLVPFPGAGFVFERFRLRLLEADSIAFELTPPANVPFLTDRGSTLEGEAGDLGYEDYFDLVGVERCYVKGVAETPVIERSGRNFSSSSDQWHLDALDLRLDDAQCVSRYTGEPDGRRITVRARLNTLDPSVPIADAGRSRTVPTGATVVLDGRGSSDDQPGPLAYRWRQIGGPTVALLGADGPTPTFVAPVDFDGFSVDLGFALEVTDEAGFSGSDQMTVRVGKSSDLQLMINIAEHTLRSDDTLYFEWFGWGGGAASGDVVTRVTLSPGARLAAITTDSDECVVESGIVGQGYTVACHGMMFPGEYSNQYYSQARVLVQGAGPGSISVRLDGPLPDPNPSNNERTASWQTMATGSFALAPTPTTKWKPTTNRTFGFTAGATEPNGLALQGAQVRFNIPAGTAFVSASVTRGSCSATATTVTCALPDLPSGTTVAGSVILKAKKLGDRTSRTVTVTGQLTSPALVAPKSASVSARIRR